MCRAEITDDTEAGAFLTHPPIPEEIRKYKKDPAAIMALAPREQFELLKLVQQQEAAGKREAFCGKCTATITSYLKEVKEGMQHQGAVN